MSGKFKMFQIYMNSIFYFKKYALSRKFDQQTKIEEYTCIYVGGLQALYMGFKTYKL